jgi:hypothetical protein
MGLLSLFDKVKEPIFLKENSDARDTLEKLKALAEIAPPSVRNKIEQDIKLLSFGLSGESNILYELKNSHMPMCVLHDLFLSDGGLTAQIDYLIITRKCIFVVECKNLIGNIEITCNGDFIRTLQYNGKYIKEGIYSPITQNQRHIELIKQIRLKEKSNFITQIIFERNFYNVYRPIVVLANEKTVLNNKFAKKEVKDKIIRADQLISYIKRINQLSESERSENDMMDLGYSFLRYHKPNPVDYTAKYQIKENTTNANSQAEANRGYGEVVVKQIKPSEPVTTPAPVQAVSMETSHSSEQLIKELKAYRLKKCREENIKAYYIFNDNQMNELIEKKPQTPYQLKNVAGFGDAKVEKYGSDIISIIKSFVS